MKRQDRIAITGGIGSGKSYVCQLLKEHWDIEVYDCDAAAKRLMRTSPLLRQQLTVLIGPDCYNTQMPQQSQQYQEPLATQVLNKAAVTRFLLASEQNARAVDAIVHPAVADDFLQSGQRWMECAILFESGFDRLVDQVIVVTAPIDVRIRRIMERDSISAQRAQEWLQRQWPQEQVCQRAQFEVVNDGQQPLIPQIEQIINIIR